MAKWKDGGRRARTLRIVCVCASVYAVERRTNAGVSAHTPLRAAMVLNSDGVLVEQITSKEGPRICVPRTE
jgi:hypothetical protein